MVYSNVSGVGKYMEILLKSQFPQSNLLDADRFLVFLKDRGIELTKEELEYYDEKEIIRPALRLQRPRAGEGHLTYLPIFTDIFGMKEYYMAGLIEFPHDGDFQPWSNYLDDNRQEKIMIYYHPFQCVPVRRLTMGDGVRLSAKFLESVKDIQERFEEMKNRSAQIIYLSRKASRETWIPRVGLLMLLEEAYGPYINGLRLNIYDHAFLQKWNEWRLKRFSPDDILTTSGMTLDRIKQLYQDLSAEAQWIDPLGNWFVLLQLIKTSKKRKLQKEALLAQDYYQLAYMVSYFIYDLTQEKMLDPDDITEGLHGTWKLNIYGRPFDYRTIKTRDSILDNYLIDRPFRLAIVVEGVTEERVIELITSALYIDLERDGFFLYNAEGRSNIEMNLRTLFYMTKKYKIETFVIVDNDKNSNRFLEKYKGNIKQDMLYKWNKDFEYDNFGTDAVVQKINSFLREKGLQEISTDKVKTKMAETDSVLMKVICDLMKKDNQIKLDDAISKKKLAESLVEERISEISLKRKNGKDWEPVLPIEKVLKRIFEMIPTIS